MKRSPRPIFTVLVLIVIGITLCFQLTIRNKGFTSFRNDDINVNLLKLASEQLGKEEERSEVERLLQRNIGRNNGRQRSFLSSVPIPFPSPQFYSLWNEFQVHLNDWWRKKRFEPEILNDLHHMFKVSIDSNSNRRYSSCAVVGNSGILLNNNHGSLIDSHEAVIRLNNARIVGFERNVGYKTNISFINSNIMHLCARRDWCLCHPYISKNLVMIMYICQPIHLMDYTICGGSGSNRSLIVTDPRFDELCARIVKYYSLKRFVEKMKKGVDEWGAVHDGSMFHYSSGFQAVMLAVGICDKVSIFGFGKSELSKHHYHTNQKGELHLHDYEAEYSIYQDLVERPKVIPFISHKKFKFPPVVIYK
ncbi:beta-1,6-galactosyltransferase GALT29A-like [Impatiens glandulifera]|uniref:beta-1,6-galactosyltransferase GALT29A-like n=1 Tax=Impatiens glandulifera TaxID=253017 RepID=UPI001FB0D52A|nr:beta-1,6-galactosyltransferase GALT29A-like [Impatiens glandulifera]